MYIHQESFFNPSPQINFLYPAVYLIKSSKVYLQTKKFKYHNFKIWMNEVTYIPLTDTCTYQGFVSKLINIT